MCENGIYSKKKYYKKDLSKLNWLFKCTLLLPCKKAKHNFKETIGNTNFQKGKEEHFLLNMFFVKKPKRRNINGKEIPPDEYGIAMHTDCWKFAKQELKHEFIYEDFNVKKIKMRTLKYELYYLFKYINYKPANKYWSQDFNIPKLIKNEKDWYILYSPLKTSVESKKNAKRIKINIKKCIKNIPKSTLKKDPLKGKVQSKKKLKKDRLSPSESAILYKIGKKKKGNDGNMYVVKSNKNGVHKWIKV